MKKKPAKRKPIKKAPKLLGAPPTSTLAPTTNGLKLDLACGQAYSEQMLAMDPNAKARLADGYIGVDRVAGPNVKHVINLFKFPWPFADNSVSQIYCSHFIEHIPMIEVDYATGDQVDFGEGIDLFLRFFDECHRVMHNEAWMEVICPAARNDRAFQDPTHRRFIVVNTFFYLWAEWRKGNGLDHYGAKCDMRGVNVTWSMTTEFASKHEQVQAREINLWNQMIDIHAKLLAVKQP